MKTVGSILKKAREKEGLSFDQVREATKIHPRFLKALETGSYSAFSSAVHLKGFLRTYARFLDLDVEEVMAFFRREYDERSRAQKIKGLEPLRGPRITLTPGWVITISAVVLVLVFLGYIVWGYQRYARPPFLAVDQPSSDITVNEEKLTISGRAGREAEVSLNGEEVALSAEGRFTLIITLSEGVNTLEFVAVNPLGRRTVVTRMVVLETPPEE